MLTIVLKTAGHEEKWTGLNGVWFTEQVVSKSWQQGGHKPENGPKRTEEKNKKEEEVERREEYEEEREKRTKRKKERRMKKTCTFSTQLSFEMFPCW